MAIRTDWIVADVTARNLIATTWADVVLGNECLVNATGSIYRAVRAGSGATVWRASDVESEFHADEVGTTLAGTDTMLIKTAAGSYVTALLSRIATYIESALPVATGSWSSAGVATTNVDTIGSITGHYLRVKDRVIAFGQVSVDPTAAAFTRFAMPVPVASNFGAVTDAVAWVGGEGTTSGRAAADATNDRLDCVYTTNSASANTQYILAFYRVI
jgi:hypothetical protein